MYNYITNKQKKFIRESKYKMLNSTFEYANTPRDDIFYIKNGKLTIQYDSIQSIFIVRELCNIESKINNIFMIKEELRITDIKRIFMLNLSYSIQELLSIS